MKKSPQTPQSPHIVVIYLRKMDNFGFHHHHHHRHHLHHLYYLYHFPHIHHLQITKEKKRRRQILDEKHWDAYETVIVCSAGRKSGEKTGNSHLEKPSLLLLLLRRGIIWKESRFILLLFSILTIYSAS